MNAKRRMILTVLFFCFLIPCVAMAEVTIPGGLTKEREARIGEEYHGVIVIQNSSDERQEVKAYQTDYLFFHDGKNIYGEPGKLGRSNANWITFSPERFIIPPKDSYTLKYTVKVPDNEALVGTYWSVIMVEGVAPVSSDTIRNGIGVRQVMRYGIQMVTHIGNTGERKIKFLNTQLLRVQEKRILQIDVENIGERWLRPVLWTELFDEEGGQKGKFDGRKIRIYPGTSARIRVDLSEVPDGKFMALVVADNGDEYIFAAQLTLNITS
jgi:hypothetical protein